MQCLIVQEAASQLAAVHQASHEQQVVHVAELAAAEKKTAIQQMMREDDVAEAEERFAQLEQERAIQVAAIESNFREIQQEMEQVNNTKIAELEVAVANEATAAVHREADLRQRAADDRATFENTAHEAQQVLTGCYLCQNSLRLLLKIPAVLAYPMHSPHAKLTVLNASIVQEAASQLAAVQQASYKQQVVHVAELAAAQKNIVIQQTMREDDVAEAKQEKTIQVAAIEINFREIQQKMEQANNIKIAELEQETETQLAELEQEKETKLAEMEQVNATRVDKLKQSNKIELFTAEKKFVEMQV